MENNTLPALVAQAQTFITATLESEGEITEQVEGLLPVMEAKIPAKIDAYVHIKDQVEMQAEYFKAKAAQFAQAAKQMEKVAESLKERLKWAAGELGTNTLEGFDFKITISDSVPSVVVENEDQIDFVYFEEVRTLKLNKAKLKEDLLMGRKVSGAHLKHGKTIRFSTNKKVG